MPFRSETYPFQADLNGDGENELFVHSNEEQKLVIYSTDIETKYGELSVTSMNDFQVSNYLDESNQSKLFLKTQEAGYFIQLADNRYYLVAYLAYPGMYGLFLLFIYIIRKINTYQITRKEGVKRRLLTLQLQSIKSQLDPHFTFNALNSVASLLYLEDRDTAYDALNKFTRLLRQMLNDAERIYRTLGEELEFVTGYLELEKVRFGDKFRYEIEIGKGVTEKEQVPKMVLQTFAENAVKHGLMPLKEGGLLKIRIERKPDHLSLTISDNGIGRAKAAATNGSLGKGLKITEEFYEILSKMGTRKISHTITDLYDKPGTSAGTQVEVIVPL
jgi:hypothetical protein